MVIETNNHIKNIEREQEKTLFAELDKGIDDMEAGRTLPHDEAMKKIKEAVSAYVV